jgi:AraC-like DNA-binding protein
MGTWREPTERRIDQGLWLDYHLDRMTPASMEEVGYEQAQPLQIDFHEALEAGIVLEGTQERSFQGFSYPVGPGDTWLCASWEPHGRRVLTPGTVVVIVVFLPSFLGDEMLGPVPWMSLLASPPSQRPRVGDDALRERLLRMGRDWQEERRQGRPDWAVGVRYDLLRMLFWLSRDWSPPPISRDPAVSSSASFSQIMPALQLVHSSPARRADIATAARLAGLSRSQFCLVFKRVMGMSFGEFCVRARLALVAQQLLGSDASVQAIAGRVGFTDASHLYRGFLKRYGCTPGEFRERGRAPVLRGP